MSIVGILVVLVIVGVVAGLTYRSRRRRRIAAKISPLAHPRPLTLRQRVALDLLANAEKVKRVASPPATQSQANRKARRSQQRSRSRSDLDRATKGLSGRSLTPTRGR